MKKYSEYEQMRHEYMLEQCKAFAKINGGSVSEQIDRESQESWVRLVAPQIVFLQEKREFLIALSDMGFHTVITPDDSRTQL
jgi:hypothetical protein